MWIFNIYKIKTYILGVFVFVFLEVVGGGAETDVQTN